MSQAHVYEPIAALLVRNGATGPGRQRVIAPTA